MDPARRSFSTASWVALIFCATLAAYGPVYRAGLIWNDEDYVTKPELQSLHGLERIWFDVGATQQYYPALHSAFWVEHRLWGDAPWGYHLANVLLHALAACLFGLLLRRLAVPGAWTAGLLFALHPVCVESVAWISEEKNTLSLVFYLLAAWAYLDFDRDRRWPGYFLALAFFLLAVLSKSVTATLPGALLVILWWRRGRLSWRDAAPLAPWFAIGAADGLFTGWVERTLIGAHGADFDLSFVQRCLVAGRVVWFYLGKIAWPANLIFIYPRWQVSAAAAWPYVFPLGALGLLAALWFLRRRSRAPLAAMLFFLGSLFPTIGFLSVYAFIFSFVADHWVYLPMLGIIALASAGWGSWVARSALGWPARTAVPAVVLGLCAVLVWRGSRQYHDPETFYHGILDRNPAAWMAHNNLGIILFAQGKVPEAMVHYEEELRLRPDYPEGHNNLGNALLSLNRPGEAMAHYRRALEINPAYLDARLDLGNVLRDTGHPQEALAEYQRALQVNSASAEVHGNLGVALEKLGRSDAAFAEFREAIRLKPDYVSAHYNFAVALHYADRDAEALTQYQAVVALDPGLYDAQTNLGAELYRVHRVAEAADHFEAAVKLRPADAGAQYRLSVVLRALGRTAEAEAHAQEALRLQGGPPR
jgi:tetratricopeptide (TPR) repeat protein